MVNVDISNIWCSVSLQDLLAGEKTIDAAQQELYGEHMPHSWLGQSDAAGHAYLEELLRAAETIRQDSQILMVVGTGLSLPGARAAQRLRFGRRGVTPRILFAGDNFSGEDWLEVISALEQTDFSVLVTSPVGSELQPLIALRSLRWIMEKRYGEQAKRRIYVAAGPQRSPLRNLAEAEGYSLLTIPADPGCAESVLNPAGLLLLAVSGMDAALVREGALAAAEACMDRSLDNPAWLYAGTRHMMAQAGIRQEYTCAWGASTGELTQWWSRLNACGDTFAAPLRLPEDLTAVAGALTDPQRKHFVTLLTLPTETKKVAVENAWQDPDCLSSLAGVELACISEAAQTNLKNAFSDSRIPLLTIECPRLLTDDRIGELLVFLECAARLSAKLADGALSSPAAAGQLLKRLDVALGRAIL